jgi:hypothetical protein
LIWTKLIIFIDTALFFFRNYKFNILRSSFVNNKSREHIKINYYSCILSLKKNNNILIYKYFISLRFYIYEYSIINIIKLFM